MMHFEVWPLKLLFTAQLLAFFLFFFMGPPGVRDSPALPWLLRPPKPHAGMAAHVCACLMAGSRRV